jgi:hypothetical protein
MPPLYRAVFDIAMKKSLSIFLTLFCKAREDYDQCPMLIKSWISITLILGILCTLPKALAFEIHARKDNVISELLEWRSELTSDTEISPREKDLRLQLANRLLFQVERKYQENDLLKFMINTVGDMKQTDEMRDNQSYGGLTEYLENLQEALETLIEPDENLINFIRDFTRFSSIDHPLSVDEFAETRDYSDGKEMEKADPMDADQAAESVAEQIATQEKASQEEALKLGSRDYLDLGKDLKKDTELQFVMPIEEEDDTAPMEPATEPAPETSHSQTHQTPPEKAPAQSLSLSRRQKATAHPI